MIDSGKTDGETFKLDSSGKVGIGGFTAPKLHIYTDKVHVSSSTVRLYVADDFWIDLHKVPSLWRRLWYWLLLGWRWEKLDD